MLLLEQLSFRLCSIRFLDIQKKRNPNPSTFHESTKLEVAWTVVPFLILIAMAVPASKTLTEIYDDEEGEINIQVVGYQWKWEYKYLEDDINFSLTSAQIKMKFIILYPKEKTIS